MKNIVLFDTPELHANLLPLSYTRPISSFLLGADTLQAKWEAFLPGEYSWLVEDYLAAKYPMTDSECPLFVASHVVATAELAEAVGALEPGEILTADDQDGEPVTVAICGKDALQAVADGQEPTANLRHFPSRVTAIKRLYDVFGLNAAQIIADYKRLTDGREGQPIHHSNIIIGNPENIFVESGAVVEGVVLNASHGPIYVGRHVEVMEGSCLRGPIALGEASTVNMGTKIYPGTSLGPHCKVGGELNNAVIFGYSNKAHDGFLGNAVLGEWCNLGAGCVASNLKNDYTLIKLWNYPAHRFLKTGLQFCGLIMGDHSKAGINTMFNTATVVGVGVNVHGSGFPRNFIASFQEGGATGFSDVSMEKFFEIAERVMARRGKKMTTEDIEIFHSIRNQAENYK